MISDSDPHTVTPHLINIFSLSSILPRPYLLSKPPKSPFLLHKAPSPFFHYRLNPETESELMNEGASVWAAMSSWLTPSFFFVLLNLTIGTMAVISSLASQRRQQNHRRRPFAPVGEASPPPLARAPSLLDRVRSFDFSLYASPHLAPVAHTQFPPEMEPSHPADQAAEDPGWPTQLARAPSLLDRVRSLKFSFAQYHPDPEFPPETELPRPVDQAAEDSDGPTRLSRPPSLLDRVKSFRYSFDKYQQESVVVPEPDIRAAEPDSDPAPVPERTPAKMRKSLSSMWSFGRRNVEEYEDEIDRRRPATMRERGSKASATETEGEDEGVDARADDFINRFRQQLKLQRLDSLLRSRGTMPNHGGASAGK